MLHVVTQLDESTEELIRRVIGCCIEVHKTLGPGLLEPIYNRAVSAELEIAGIPFEREKRFPVNYRGKALYTHQLDLVVDQRLMIELKAVDYIQPVHRAQVLSCLRVSKLRVGLLMNFNVALLPDGIRRIVL